MAKKAKAQPFVLDGSVTLAWYFQDEADPYADAVAASRRVTEELLYRVRREQADTQRWGAVEVITAPRTRALPSTADTVAADGAAPRAGDGNGRDTTPADAPVDLPQRAR